MQSTFFALSAQQEARQAENELGCCGCWTTWAVVTWVDDWVWPVDCKPPVPPSPLPLPPPLPTALPGVSRMRQLAVESPHPSMTLQPCCCCSHPEILAFLLELRFMSPGPKISSFRIHSCAKKILNSVYFDDPQLDRWWIARDNRNS